MTRTARTTLRPGFTLVEMTIAIGIIVLLTALTVTASLALVNRAEIRKTENVLLLLDSALAEWESRADRQASMEPTPPVFAPSYEMYLGTPTVLTASELLQKVRRHDDARAVMGRIETDQLVKYDSSENAPAWLLGTEPADTPDALSAFNAGTLDPADVEPALAVLDAWGKPIIAVHPGWLWRDGVDPGAGPADVDGTVRNPQDVAGTGTGIENRYGIAKSRRVYFMSAGPDELYGDLSGNTAERKATEDNIYSYEVETP